MGKTAIVNRFLNNKFNENYTPTIEDFHRKIYRIRGEAYRLDLLDTSGNNPFPAMRRLLLLTGVFVLIKTSVSRLAILTFLLWMESLLLWNNLGRSKNSIIEMDLQATYRQ